MGSPDERNVPSETGSEVGGGDLSGPHESSSDSDGASETSELRKLGRLEQLMLEVGSLRVVGRTRFILGVWTRGWKAWRVVLSWRRRFLCWGGAKLESLSGVVGFRNGPTLPPVSANPYQYQHHSGIIAIHRELGRYDELKLARERMRALFPLDQAIWLEWLKDEMALAASEDECKRVVALFDTAVEDYLALPVWELYVDYLVERFADGLSLDVVRDRMRRAVLATQYHYGGGHAIWNRVLQFEEHMLELAPSDAQTKAAQELYSAHLLIPHNEIEDTFARFSSFAANANYSESLKISLELGPYEDYLAAAAFVWEAYHAYIDFLKSRLALGKNLGVWLQLIRATYERAAAHHPTTPALWESYAVFLISHFPGSAIFNQVALRGVRNCPWSGPLGVFYLRSLEPSGLEAVEGKLHQSLWLMKPVALDELLASRMLYNDVEELAQVLLERCSIAQRLQAEFPPGQVQRLRGLFRDSVDKLYSAFPAGDSHYRGLKYWAEVESFKFKDVGAARKVWGEILRRHKNRASAWLQFVQFEAQFGTLAKARGLLAQAYRTPTDDPAAVMVAWEDFERLHGDASSNQRASSDIHAAQLRHLNRVNDIALQQAEKQAQLAAQRERARARNKANKAKQRASKRKRQPRDAAADQRAPLDSKAQEVEAGEDAGETKKPRLSECAGTALFVSNFAPEVDCARLRGLFEKYGRVHEVRRPNSKVGVPRNFAYVEFATPEEAKGALELDGHVMERELALSVKLSDPSRRKPRVAGPQPSPKRLFVANLPTGMAQNKGVLALFSPFGAVDHVRIFTDRSGAPNGRAVVEFSQEARGGCASGLSALSLNSTLVEGRVLTVCIADPSARPNRPRDGRGESADPLPQAAATSTEGEPLPRQTSFKPRQVAHTKRPHNRLGVDPAQSNLTRHANPPAKSNRDFRNWLLGNPDKP
ncbi:Splicing factor [Massospora cicadina]|nr:Splicing factor [Massospora cicadina]